MKTSFFVSRTTLCVKAIVSATATLVLAVATMSSTAAPFEIGATPTRFILTGKSASRIGQTLTVFNLGTAPTELALRTLDWTFTEAGNVTYHDELLPNSCRTWVTLERKTLKIGARDKRTFRFARY